MSNMPAVFSRSARARSGRFPRLSALAFAAGVVASLASLAPAYALSAEEKALVDKANTYFNGVKTMVADFSQTGSDGRRSKGELSILKPGKLRFEYEKPSPVQIISDGKSVAVRDRKLGTQDLYLIGQTPLKFLTRATIDITRDTKVLDVEDGMSGAIITIEDKATMGGTSRIRLEFSKEPFELKRWTVSDPQGGDTVVTLSNVDYGTKPDAAAFRIEQQINSSRER